MLHREFKPNTLLTPYIETYWSVCGYKQEEEFHKILPDGCIDIIFSFESNQLGLDNLYPNMVGALTAYSIGSYSNRIDLIGIRFKPFGITAFARTPIYEFTNKRINLTLIESLFDELFYVELPEKASAELKVNHIDSYFLSKLQRGIFELDSPIVYAVNLIRTTSGQLPLVDVASKCCLSLRHFERKFKTSTGVSPKTFSKIVKFQHTISYLKNNNNSLYLTAIDCGYYDQAHMIKDFRTFSGNSPSNFRIL